MRALLTVAWLVAAAFLAWHAIAYKAPAIEQDILARSAAAVKTLNARAEVFAYGRFIVLRGQVPDEESKAAILTAADGVSGALGPYDELLVSTYKAAAIVLAEKAPDGSLQLSGTVPSDDARNAVENAAKAAFSGVVDNRLVTADTETMSVKGVEDAFKTLASLDAGTLLMNSARLLISGSSSDPAKTTAARELAAAHQEAWQLVIDEPASASVRFGAVKLPDGTILASGDVPSEDARAALLETFRDGDPDQRIVDRMSVRADGLPEAWAVNAMKGAKALVELDWGSMSLDGAKSYLTGMAGPHAVGAISDGLGDAFTAELTPRPADPTPGRISTLERELNAAKSRLLDISAAAAKHLADLNAAEARVDDLRNAGSGDKAEAEAASKRIAELEAAADQSRADLEAANARIAGLTEMLSLRPSDAPLPADALPAPSASTVLPLMNKSAASTEETAAVAAPPVEIAPAPEPPPVTSSMQEPEAPVETAALSPSRDPERVADACNAVVGSLLEGASITFESKSAQITREGNDVLDRLIAETAPCIGNPALKVTVGGHTDNRGQDRDNLRLSKDRADSVKESLIVRSIPPDAITAIGYGETMPVSDNDTEEGRTANRRITIDWSLR